MAQNLVPNPSFEEYTNCPDFPGQVWRAEGWYVAENTPDYYNCCCNLTFPVCGVPQNQFSFRYAATGAAYCGIYTYLNYPPTDFQEKMGVELLAPLEIGVRYYVSMKVSSVNTYYNQISNGAHNKLGILFSSLKYDVNNRPPNNNYAQFYSDSIVIDTVGWVTIKGAFIADSAYRFLTVGNFFDNNNIDTIRYWEIPGNPGNTQLLVYYFIDDICVTTDSSGCEFHTIITNGECIATGISTIDTKNAFRIYPNPADSYFSVESELDVLSIFEFCNLSGQVLLRQNIPKGHYMFNQDVSQIDNGVYFLKLVTNNQTFSQKLIVYH
jgi:hypothetical protein